MSLNVTRRPVEEVGQFSWPEPLGHVFRAIFFDWDGTAVEERSSSARSLIDAMEQMLCDGVFLVIITGTRLEHLERQALGSLSRQAKRRLFVCTNRGSEVFGYDSDGYPKLLFKRTATPKENSALDEAAQRFRALLTQDFGLKAEVISNRLNRRKIDLIPEWENPRKSQFQELLNAVERRLSRARVFGGLRGLVRQALLLAEEAGLQDPRVTSDVKHIEIGLTDKSHSAAWAKTHVLDAHGIALRDVILIGDEFGDVGGISGSDSLMSRVLLSTPGNSATFMSVGKEPNGAGERIHDLKGGPERFVEFLNYQTRLRRLRNLSPTPDPAWCVEQEGFEPSREREMEAIFAIGNGYLGVRGSLDTPIPISQPDLLIAGIYDRKVIHHPYSELEFLTPSRGDHPYSELVALPSPFRLKLTLNGRPLSLVERKWNRHVRILDLKKGMFFEKTDFVDEQGRMLRVRTLRCASIHDHHLLLHEIEIDSEHEQGDLEIELPPFPENFHSTYPHLTRVPKSDLLRWVTHASKFEIAIAARTSQDGHEIQKRRWVTSLRPGTPIRIRRMIGVFTSRDSENAPRMAKQHVFRHDFDSQLALHEARWNSLWNQSDVVFEGDPGMTEVQRFNSYHLLIASPRSDLVSIGARTLSGRGYEGHVFWDSEIFMLPFFLNAAPQTARNMLLYRHRTLPGARIRAEKMGCHGACFAWESTVTGDDVTPDQILLRSSQREIPIFTGRQQIHVTADVAYGIWLYWKATLDERFMLDAGLEILIETARFWSTRCSSGKDALHILDVVGPDEYHHGVNDNAFTNWMARFNLRFSVEMCQRMKTLHPRRWDELSSKLAFKETEIDEWVLVANELFVPGPDRNGVIEQFEGFFDLEPISLGEQELFRAPIDRLFDWEKVNKQQLIKQADVLMLPFLFRDRFTPKQIVANYRYYEPITDHGSSLSPSVHATIAAWIGDHAAFEHYYHRGAELDLFNLMRNSGLGMHAANMGGIWQALVYGVLGIRRADVPQPVEPDRVFDLMRGYEGIRLNLVHQGKSYPIHLQATEKDDD